MKKIKNQYVDIEFVVDTNLNSKIKIKRKTSRRISNKLKNSALPVVNYSRLLKSSKNYEKLFINESYRNLEKQDIKA